jgi:hypothetical protein
MPLPAGRVLSRLALPLAPAVDFRPSLRAAYLWFNGGCFYFGGLLVEDPSNPSKQIYNSGRHEFPTRCACVLQAAYQ